MSRFLPSERGEGVFYGDCDDAVIIMTPGDGVDREELIASMLAGDEEARGMAIMIVPWDAYRPGALEDASFRKLWVAVRQWGIPRLIKSALDGYALSQLYLHDVYRRLDPTIEAPWEHIPNPVAETPYEPSPYTAGVDIEVLRLGLQRIWADAVERAVAGA